MARIKRYNSDTGQWEYCNTGGMPIKGIDYLTRADYDTMRADMDAYLERNKESVGVTVSGNQAAEDVYGASVRIVGEDGSVIGEKAWNGSELVFRMEAGTVYHVEVDASEQGFSGHVSETFTAVKGGTRTLVAEVYAEKVNVGVEGIDSGFTVTVKEEYTPVEYIESSGAQYIDTGFAPTSEDLEISVVYEHTSTPSAQSVFGSQQVSPAVFSLVCYNNPNAMIYVGSSTQLLSTAISVGTKYALDVHANNGTLTVVRNGVTSSAAYTGSLYKSNSMFLFANSKDGEPVQMSNLRLYSCQIYDNGVLVRDYIPVMNGSGVYGLYDKVNGVFYASATSTGLAGLVKTTDTFLTLTETGGSCLVPYGTVYSVSATAVDGYATPSSQTFTANVDSRSVVMTYEENLLGVFIEDVNGKLWTSDAWDGSVTANGVAVCTENCRFVMALGNTRSECVWSSNTRTVVSGIVTTADSSTAATDYLGDANTTQIISQLGADNAPAANYCRSYTFPNGATGYLGAAGEWQAALDNKSAIVTALTACGGTDMSDYYWTSTQYGTSSAWITNAEYLKVSAALKDDVYPIRAFTTLKRDTN